MQRILSRRVFRDLKANFFRYLALFLLIVLGMYMVVAIIASADIVITGVEQSYMEHHGEDGQFGTFVPLNEEELLRIADLGVTLEEAFYLDYHLGESTLRVMKDREQINLFVLSQGRGLEGDGEILLEQHYAQVHGLEPGSKIQIGSLEFTVAGLGSTPDYDAPLEKLSDTSVDSSLFGTAFVTAKDYQALKEAGESFKTEEYIYSYLLNGGLTDEELKELLQAFELDRDQVTDTYFLEELERSEETKNEIVDGIDELLDGCRELSDGLQEIADHNDELRDAVDTLFDTMLQEANDSFRENDIHVELQEDTFEEQLDAMIASVSVYSKSTRDSLQELKDTLEELEAFRDGAGEFRQGVGAAKDGSGALHSGLSQIAENSDALNQAAGVMSDMVFQAALAQLNQQLETQLGPLLQAQGLIFVPLTEEDYEARLDELIASYGSLNSEWKTALEEAKEQLSGIRQFPEGLQAYTSAVALARDGSLTLTEGMIQLDDASYQIYDGTQQLLEAMVEMVQEQLAESGIEVELTTENFETRLDQLMAPGSQVDAKLQETLRDTKESFQDIRDFQDGVKEYTDAVEEAAEGSRELTEGVEELQEAADELIEEFFTFEPDNLTSFLPKADNPRIAASIGDVKISLYAGIAAGVILMVLFTYVISVFVVHGIERESSIIGTLYAMGVRQKQLLFHYLLLPVLVTFFGGIAGSCLGFSPWGQDWMMESTITYYSVPPLKAVYSPYLICYSILMPPVMAMLVNRLVISKKLKATALSLIRNEQRTSRIRDVKLSGKLGFIRRFQIRQFLRELRSGMAVVGGMYVCLLVLMLSLDCYVLCENYRIAAVQETRYEYMYTYKYPTEEAPEGGTACYMESLKREAYGYKLDVMVLGIEEGNPYFNVEVSPKQNEIVISAAVAEKFGLKEGDKLVLSDEVNDRDYAFTVKSVVQMDSAFYTFMELDAMRELFGQEEDYYNVVFSDRALEVDSGRLYSTTTRQNILEASEVFSDMMAPMVVLLCSLSALIFIVVMYLMLKVMIDRSAFSIVLVKLFGFRKREIKKLYINGNFFLVALGALLCIPLSKLSVDALFPWCIANVAMGMNISFSWKMYLGIFLGILLCYFAINPLLLRRISKMVPAEVLKTRE